MNNKKYYFFKYLGQVSFINAYLVFFIFNKFRINNKKYYFFKYFSNISIIKTCNFEYNFFHIIKINDL